MPRGHIRSAIDVSRISSLVQRPGIDPRVNLTLGVVTELGFDSEKGIFADVQFIPSGETETCYVGAAYAGGGFGMYAPLRVDDTVVVAVPNGDPNHGPVIVQRVWNSGDPPSADFKAAQQDNGSDVPTDDFVLRVREGQNLKIRVAGAGTVDIKAEGSGDIAIKQTGTGNVNVTAANLVNLQDGTQAFVRGNDYASALQSFLNAMTAFDTAFQTFITTTSGATTAAQIATAANTFAPFFTAMLTAITTFINASSTYLSSKVKGQ